MDGGRCGDADRCWSGRNRGMCSKMVGWWCWGLRHGDGGLSVRVVPTYVHTVKHPVWFPRCHSAIQLSRATIELFFFSLSLTSLPVPSRVGDCFLILDPCHQVRVSSDAYFTVQRSLCVESWIKRVQLITISRVSFERKAAGDKGPVYPRGLNRIRMEETAQIKPA